MRAARHLGHGGTGEISGHVDDVLQGVASAIIVYDIARRDTFVGAKKGVHEVQMGGAVGCVVVLCGSKLDRDGIREATHGEAPESTRENNLHMCVEVGAETGGGLSEVSLSLSRLLLTRCENDLAERSDGSKALFEEEERRDEKSGGGRETRSARHGGIPHCCQEPGDT